MPWPPIVLASASPRRLELLRLLGIEPRVLPADIHERSLEGEAPDDFAARMAREKAAAVAGGVEEAGGAWVIAADTVVVQDGRTIGKPVDAADARRMLEGLSGRAHDVVTGTCLLAPGGREVAARVVRTRVEMRPLGADELDWYLATGEWHDKAGAYAVQGSAGSFVRRVDGSPTNVIGLPLAEVAEDLRAAGLRP